jgi:hypothetical protein
MMRAKNEARKYFAEQNLERKENGLEVRKTESEVSVASVELREYPVVGPENQEPTSTQECEQRQDRDMARQQLPLEHLEILDESTTESAITDTESSDTDDSDDVTVIINLETQAAEEAEIVEEAARAAALRIPEELTQDSTGLLKPYSGIPNENRDRGTNLEKLPKELRNMQNYDEKPMKWWEEAMRLRNMGSEHWDSWWNDKVPARSSDRRVTFNRDLSPTHPGQWNGQFPPVAEYREADQSEYTFGLHVGEVWANTKKYYLEDYLANRNRRPRDEIESERSDRELNVGAQRLVEMGIDKYHKRLTAEQVQEKLHKEDRKKVSSAISKLTIGHGYLEEQDLRLAQRDLARWALELGPGFMRHMYDESQRDASINLEIIRMSLYYGLRQLGKMVLNRGKTNID